MKYFVSVLFLVLYTLSANAASNARPAMSGKMIMSAPRYTASVNQLNGVGAANSVKVPTTEDVVEVPVEEEKKDMREAERNACINNNIGIGNTFVWASRYSDTSNYTNMIEDVENPENNVCFVRVELKSDDESRVKVSDIAPKYFMWGESIECGSWANEQEMEQRILDARKGARIGGIVASTVGGVGLGIGAMELIGNSAIDDWKGQKSLSGTELYKSELLVLKNSKKDSERQKYEEVKNYLLEIEAGKEQLSDDEYSKYKDLIELVKQ
nr:hypothetical protein [Candidatus Enterousia merdequi]